MERFVARQPIFDRHQKVYAYELLFRSSLENVYSHANQDVASSDVIVSSFFLLDIQTITGGNRAFINVTRDVLVREFITMLPKEIAVVELLESITADTEVLFILEKLKKEGYLIALDDFVYNDQTKGLVDLADIIKVDLLSTTSEDRRSLIKELAPRGIKFLAEKVETQEIYQESLEMGFTYFQGYFFSRPHIISGRDIPGVKLNYLRILQEIHKPSLDFEQIEGVIRVEISLCYKLLRYINSPFFGVINNISSIKQALVLLGERDVKKWVSLLALATMGEDQPEELVLLAIIRAKFCESLASYAGLMARSADLFLMGMFSLIDTILSRPLDSILSEIPISDDVKSALLGEENQLRYIYDCVIAYERGEWEKLSEVAAKLGIDEYKTPQVYLSSVDWAMKHFKK